MHLALKIMSFASVIHATIGIRCYECAYGDTREASDVCRSENLNPSLVRNCDVSTPYCLNATGLVDSVPTGVRFCADANWAHVLGGHDRCLPREQVPEFSFKLDGREVELVNGVLCLCSHDECNGYLAVKMDTSSNPKIHPGINAVSVFLLTILACWRFILI